MKTFKSTQTALKHQSNSKISLRRLSFTAGASLRWISDGGDNCVLRLMSAMRTLPLSTIAPATTDHDRYDPRRVSPSVSNNIRPSGWLTCRSQRTDVYHHHHHHEVYFRQNIHRKTIQSRDKKHKHTTHTHTKISSKTAEMLNYSISRFGAVVFK